MTIDIPEICECTHIEVCNRCRWETACAIEELAQGIKTMEKFVD